MDPKIKSEASGVKPDFTKAIQYAFSLPVNPVTLTAILPDGGGPPLTATFVKANISRVKAMAWVRDRQKEGRNLYLQDCSVASINKRPVKDDVNLIHCAHVDLDTPSGAPEEIAAAVAKAESYRPEPTDINCSGGGVQCFWYLDAPLTATPENIDRIERINRRLALDLNADASCKDVAHLMRLPFTTNFPNKKKVAAGRVKCVSYAIKADHDFDLEWHRITDLPTLEATAEPEPPDDDGDDLDWTVPNTVDLSKLEPSFRNLIVYGPPEGKKFGDGTRSAYTYHVAGELLRQGFTPGQVIWVITNPDFAVSAHILDQKQREPEEQAARILRDLLKKGEGYSTAAEDFAEPEEPTTPEQEAEQRKQSAKYDRPSVLIAPGKLPKIVRRVQDNLIKATPLKISDIIFQRGGELVHLNRNRLKPRKPGALTDASFHVENDLLVKRATYGWLTDRTMRAMDFVLPVKPTKDDPEPEPKVCDVPVRVINILGEIGTSWKFPKLVATVEAPTLRPDGSLLQSFGYDARSGLFLDDAGVTFPPVKDDPTKVEAMQALDRLKRPLADFEFRDSDGIANLSLSVQLSAMLTACVRRSLPMAPTYGFGANDVSAGKTQLAQVNAIMSNGRRTGERPFTSDPDEQRKLLSAAFAAGDSVLLFDNVDVLIEGGPLCSVITGETMTTRKLGGNSAEDEITAPTRSLIMFTGNKLTAQGDMTSRVLVCTLYVGETIRVFKFLETVKAASLDEYLIEHRPALVAAALTIIRAWITAGRPKTTKRCRFPAWQAFCADPLVWLGYPDPCLAFARAVKSDPERERFSVILREWLKLPTPGEWRTTKQLMATEGVAEAIANARGVSVLTQRNASEYLKTMTDKVVEGYRLEHVADTSKHAARWRIIKA